MFEGLSVVTVKLGVNKPSVQRNPALVGLEINLVKMPVRGK